MQFQGRAGNGAATARRDSCALTQQHLDKENVLVDTCCCFAGPKHTMVSVLPFQSTSLIWQLVAYSSGYLSLPNIELVSKQHKVLLSACHGRQVHILPAKLPQRIQPISGPVDNLANSVSQLAIGQSQLVA